MKLSVAMILGIAGLVITVITWAISEYLRGRRHRRLIEERNKKEQAKKDGEHKALVAWRAKVEVHEAMESLREIGVGRVFIVMVENEGKIPKVGSKLYISGIDAVSFSFESAHDIVRRYDRVIVDADYNEFCAEIALRKENYIHRINVPDVEPKSGYTLIQKFYKEEGVAESDVYHLFTDVFYDEKTKKERFRMFIMSLAMYKDEGANLDELPQGQIHLQIDRIRQKFKEGYD